MQTNSDAAQRQYTGAIGGRKRNSLLSSIWIRTAFHKDLICRRFPPHQFSLHEKNSSGLLFKHCILFICTGKTTCQDQFKSSSSQWMELIACRQKLAAWRSAFEYCGFLFQKMDRCYQ